MTENSRVSDNSNKRLAKLMTSTPAMVRRLVLEGLSFSVDSRRAAAVCSIRLVLQDHVSDRVFSRVGEREVRALHSQLRCKLGGYSIKRNCRASAGHARHFHLTP